MNCKLCNNDSVELIKEIKLLDKYTEELFKCTKCDFVSFNKIHWLEEAYKETITQNDSGLTKRVLTNYAFILNFTTFLNLSTTVFDFGANNGLFSYLLNARGIRAKSFDRFETNIIGPLGSIDDLHDVGILCAFEVFEHLDDPAGDIDILFSQNVPFIIVSTELHDRHTDFNGWWYLQKDTGQHISFYSEKTMMYVAKKYHYEYAYVSGRHIFSKYSISRKAFLKIRLAQKLRYRFLRELF